MADYTVLYWQNIPSLVEAKDATGKHKAQLSDRFQALIDAAAMRQGLAGSDAYLEAWRRSRPQAREGSAAAVAAAVQAELEAEFDTLRATVLGKA